MSAHVYTKDSPWPDADAGTIAVVHYGDYRRQEIWVLCGSNVGNWYPLGNPYGNRALNDPAVPEHPHWEDIVARGPVTILGATSKEAYRAGWADGRRHLFEQVEQEYEWGPYDTPASVQGAADGEAQAAGEVCACGPKQYCHLDNCQGVDGPLIPCPTVGCTFACDSLAEMDDHVGTAHTRERAL